jgi:hypothetical protein
MRKKQNPFVRLGHEFLLMGYWAVKVHLNLPLIGLGSSAPALENGISLCTFVSNFEAGAVGWRPRGSSALAVQDTGTRA